MKTYLLTEEQLNDIITEALVSPAQTAVQQYLMRKLGLDDDDIGDLIHEATEYTKLSNELTQYEVDIKIADTKNRERITSTLEVRYEAMNTPNRVRQMIRQAL